MSNQSGVRARDEVGRAAWDAFVESSNEAWLWHRFDLIDALSLWPDRSDLSFAVVDRSGAIKAIVPLHRVSTRVLHVVRVVRLSSLGGPACAENMPVSERDSVLSALNDHLRHLLAKENAIVAEAQIAPLTPSLVHSRNSKVNPLIALDFDNTQAETWMVDLSSAPDEIRRKYSELTRRELRKAARSDITLREASGTRDLEAYYRLHLETYSRTGATPHPIEYFQAIFERFQPSGLSRILFAEREGRIVAAQNTGRYKTGAIYWTGASISEKAGGENRLLFDAQIMAARADGFAFYETGQAFVNSKDSKESGLSNFKRSFGAELYPYYQGILHSSRLVFRGLWSLRHLMRAVRNQ